MKKTISLTLLLAISTLAYHLSAQTITAQGTYLNQTNNANTTKELKEYRFEKTSGKLSLDVGTAVIEGYQGKEVVISTMVENTPVDERAAGLQKITPSGLQDNTGLGLNRQDQDDLTQIRQVKTHTKSDTIHIRIPEHLNVTIKGRAIWGSGDVSVKNVTGEIEISQISSNVRLSDITGPVTVKTTNGNIEAIFTEPVQGPISLISNFGFVDVAFPQNIKANIDMNAIFGDLYASEDFKIEPDTTTKTEDPDGVPVATGRPMVAGQGFTISRDGLDFNRFGLQVAGSLSVNNSLKGTINGGGEHIILRTTQGKIYLRKTQ